MDETKLLDELRTLSTAVSESLIKLLGPYRSIIITGDSIRIVEDLHGIPLEGGDHRAG